MASPNWPAIRAGIFAGESGGDYDALFGFSNRPGGRFANARLTDMTVDQALNFASPSGPYGQWVKGKIGRVATPMGGYQVVGTTLKAAKEGLGLTGNERMTPETQDMIGQWILAKQGTGAWEGYKGPRDPASFPAAAPALSPDALQFAANNPQPGGFGSAVERQLGGAGVGGAIEGTAPKYEPPAPFGSFAPRPPANNGIDPTVAAYATADEKDTWGNRLANAGKAFDDAIMPAPRPSAFPGGPSADQANGLLKATSNIDQLAKMLLQRRMG